ncbi:DegT/DnrJ/EryC1/StrS family aminotransferase [Dongshaea marina]|uniref:DegT/DnrJ/EryC1/StrS family aminotransferase n=1 Tax=Dongshaea marina TaxID=2047966 RepID=UPI000D3E4BC2|nr:DegT/DnrJ/EryC1/StrS family aminotransferase [Dongshaea marina]
MTVKLFHTENNQLMEDISIEILRSGNIASGEYVNKFERGLESVLNQKHVVTLNNMSNAIFLALYLSGVSYGDEVITTSFACMATNSSIATLGATVRWVDLERQSVCMDPAQLELAINERTKAVILYHTSGYPAQVKIISEICRKHNIVLIEDCDNAFLATLDGINVGSFGDFSIYSFYPNRLINTLDGAALVCRDKKDAIRAKKLSRYGIDNTNFRNDLGEINSQSDIPEAGWAMGLSNYCSALGYVQLGGLGLKLERTRRNTLTLIDGLSHYSEIQIINPVAGSKPSYWTLLILCHEREALLRFLRSKNIHASSLHYRNDSYSCFVSKSNVELTNTKYIQEKILSIPCGWWLTEDDLQSIISSFAEIMPNLNKTFGPSGCI